MLTWIFLLYLKYEIHGEREGLQYGDRHIGEAERDARGVGGRMDVICDEVSVLEGTEQGLLDARSEGGGGPEREGG